jgi:hypothetical protein
MSVMQVTSEIQNRIASHYVHTSTYGKRRVLKAKWVYTKKANQQKKHVLSLHLYHHRYHSTNIPNPYPKSYKKRRKKRNIAKFPRAQKIPRLLSSRCMQCGLIEIEITLMRVLETVLGH